MERALPSWYEDVKLGIFIHWTAASIPAFAPVPKDGIWPLPGGWEDPTAYREAPYAEAYQATMAFADNSTARYHAEHYPGVTYEDFVFQWKELLHRWDPELWADLFARAGAGYAVLTTKIEDGFLLWPSAHPNPRMPGWQIDRDVVGELAAALRDRGIRFGVYYSGMDYTFSDAMPPLTDLQSEAAAYPRNQEYSALAEAHWRELIERYKPSVLWSDFGLPEREGSTPDDLFRWYYERVPDGVVNDRFDENRLDHPVSHRDFQTYEYKRDFTDATQEIKWEANRGMGFSYGYNRQETDADYSSSTVLIRELLDIVARGGNFLLNVGPTATGTIPWLQAKRLLEIGWWLRRYGGAITGTRRWDRPTGTTGDGMDVRYTASDDAVHAVVLGVPAGASIVLDVTLDADATVALEDQVEPLVWEASDRGIRIELPEPPDGQPAMAIRLSPGAAVHSAHPT